MVVLGVYKGDIEDKVFWTEKNQTFPEFTLFLILSWI
jgi:hypothetical protein